MIFTALSYLLIVALAIVALGTLLLPEMLKRGYHPRLAMGPIMAIGGVDMLIPPSALTVLLGSLASLLLVVVPKRWREPFMREMAGRTFQLFLWGCERGGIMELDLTALDALQGERGLVIVANHPSMIDVFLIVSRVRQCICLMKSSLGGNLFLGDRKSVV